jgi:chloramphenicol 3-O-phosphotransferase
VESWWTVTSSDETPHPSRPAARRLILVSGQEGAGKTTIIRALLPHTPRGARIDAEDLGQVNPCLFDDAFWRLLRANVAGLVRNYWAAGFENVIAGSFFTTRDDFLDFRELVPKVDEVYMVQLLVQPEERQHRRLTRAKRTTQEWRDRVDQFDTVDTTIATNQEGYRYLAVDGTGMTPEQTVATIVREFPEIYGARLSSI